VRQLRNRSPRLAQDEARRIDDLLAELGCENREQPGRLSMLHRPPQPAGSRPAVPDADILIVEPQPDERGRSRLLRGRPSADLDAETRWADLLLTNEAQRTANRSPAFLAANTEMDAARPELLTSLLHRAMLPEIRTLAGTATRAAADG
jgi:hypothetical protein